MDLLRILLVDDEEEVRVGIRCNIEWKKLGFTLVGEAENGEDALEMLEILEPDVVLTDIRMPYMDGLELAEKIRLQYSYIKVIIISGFDEFEYAKRAIANNILDYILKPVDEEELGEILIKAYEKISKEREEKRDIKLLKERYEKSLPLVREHLLMDLLHGKLKENTTEIKEVLNDYRISVSEGKEWFVAVLAIEELSDVSKQLPVCEKKEYLYLSVMQQMEDYFENNLTYTALQNSRGLTAMIAIKDKDSFGNVVESLNYFCLYCKKTLHMIVTAGVGSAYHDLQFVKNSYEEAKEALDYSKIIGKGNVIYIRDVERIPLKTIEYDSDTENELVSAIKFSNREEIICCMDKIINQISDKSVLKNQQEMYYIYIVNTLINLMFKYELDTNKILGPQKTFVDLVKQLLEEESAKEELKEVCCRIHEYISCERNDTKAEIISLAKDFIEKNYQDENISGTMISQYLHVSPAYFSTLFKKETGKSYVNYLTELRLNKAAQLLKQTKEKAYVIALKVGYTEPNYFSYVFKKKFGVSPNKYREGI